MDPDYETSEDKWGVIPFYGGGSISFDSGGITFSDSTSKSRSMVKPGKDK